MGQIEDIMKDMQINDTFHSDLCDFEIEEVITKHISNMKEANICAIISDIGRNRTSDMSVNDIRMYLEKHLEPQKKAEEFISLRPGEYMKDEFGNIITYKDQKKAEVCKSCLGKKQLSEYKGVTVACADFPGDKSYVVDKGGIVMADCSRCKGTGEEPMFIPEPQQEDKKAEEYIPRCVKCGNSIKWDYDDEYCCECGAKFKQQEDKKIEALKYDIEGRRPTNTPLTDANMSRIESKINEIILYLNNL